MTQGEIDVLEWAVRKVRHIRGRNWPLWACVNDLLDHFLSVYDSAPFRAMRKEHPLLERDGWRCQVPGCDAYTGLHLHHIVYRSHGGGDEPHNLTTLCDHHHQALHDNWIRCRGRAPDRLYWELGVSPREGPIARIFGHRRLHRAPGANGDGDQPRGTVAFEPVGRRHQAAELQPAGRRHHQAVPSDDYSCAQK